MRLSLSRTAASILYFSAIQLFLILAILGLFEYFLLPELLMPVIEPNVALIALAGAVLLQLLFKQSFSGPLRGLVMLLLGLSLIGFGYFQYSLWTGINASWVNHNPFSKALYAVIGFALVTALLLKLRYGTSRALGTKLANSMIFFVTLIGIGLWYFSSITAINNEATLAKNKIKLIETMLNENISEQQKALSRIKTRLESLDVTHLTRLAAIDMQSYRQDYAIIKGMLLLDKQLQVIEQDDFAQQFINQGRLAIPVVRNWLKNAQKVKYAVHAATLNTKQPLVMFVVPITPKQGPRFTLLALLDINLLIENQYIKYLDSYDVYIELSPTHYLSISQQLANENALSTLLSRYHHYMSARIDVMGIMQHDVYSFISDYTRLRNNASVNQLILWLSLVFISLFTLAANSALLLRKQTKQLYKMAEYDELTGLLRRDALHQTIAKISLTSQSALVFFNLDGFNAVNNSLGHELGDAVLQRVAKRIKSNAQHADALARFGNDEFILFYRYAHKSTLVSEINQLIQSLAQIYSLGEVDLHLTVSVGIAKANEQQQDSKLLLQQADIAMDRAKSLGGNQFSFYHRQMDKQYQALVSIRGELQKAINNNQLEVYYQPIHRNSDQQIVAVESLVRWNNNGHFISPAVFIPIAEQTGQIVQVGEQVLNQVLADMSNSTELNNISVAVNFSVQQIQQQGFATKLSQLVSAQGLEPQQLTVEVTETVMSEQGSIEVILKQIMQQGFNLAIDDFGTGYSSLAYLSRQPSNIIKIDREFTIGADQPGQQQTLLHAIINICLQQHKQVVVEGVETQALMDYLAQFKQLHIQGYYYAKPMPLTELIDYINHLDD